MEEDTYRTTVGRGYCMFFLAFPAAIVIGLTSVFMITQDDADLGETLLSLWLFILIFLICSIMTIYLYCKIRYTFRDDGLQVTGLFTNIFIPYETITEVKEVSDGWELYRVTFTVMSMDQLEIVFDNTSQGRSGLRRRWQEGVTISPARKEEFMTKLESKLLGKKIIRYCAQNKA